ncbi:MAG: DUF1549 domain-containing protein, partial [Planctomycetia bacterium]
MPDHRPFLCLVLLAASVGVGRAGDDVDYSRDVQPIFVKHCGDCHGPGDRQAGLRLDRHDRLLLGGDNGPGVVAGKPNESRVFLAASGSGGKTIAVMPPEDEGERLGPGELVVLRRWIEAGAVGPKTPEPPLARETVRSDHWSFQPIARPMPPAVPEAVSSWVRNPIDRFIAARLAKEDRQPSHEADRVTLIRRATLDVVGLPPSPEAVAAFVADPRPDAYERLIDRLLAHPAHGERWGRWWLDVARYADSDGYTIDGPRTIWPYRDWVVAALNDDLPFDQFTVRQLAGDLLSPNKNRP